MTNFNLSELRFDSTGQQNVALVDATTVHDICSPVVSAVLTQPLGKRLSGLELDEILHAIYTANTPIYVQENGSKRAWNVAAFAAALNILERMCIHDQLLVDVNALRSVSNDIKPSVMQAFSEVLHTISIPYDTYLQVSRSIDSYLDVLKSWKIPSELAGDFPNWRAESRATRILIDGDKAYHDFLASQYQPAFGSSNITAHRTLFYLELAHVAGCPVFLSPSRWQSFPYLREKIQKDLYKAIESIFESQLTESAKGHLEKHFGLHFSLPGPPLLRLIVNNARDRKLSLLESTLEIRSRPNAQHFRNMIFDLQKYVIHGGSSLVQLDRRLSELEKIAATWYEKGIGYGTRVETRTIELEAIPTVGWLFKLLSIGKVELRAPRLKQSPKYLTFISSWYQI